MCIFRIFMSTEVKEVAVRVYEEGYRDGSCKFY